MSNNAERLREIVTCDWTIGVEVLTTSGCDASTSQLRLSASTVNAGGFTSGFSTANVGRWPLIASTFASATNIIHDQSSSTLHTITTQFILYNVSELNWDQLNWPMGELMNMQIRSSVASQLNSVEPPSSLRDDGETGKERKFFSTLKLLDKMANKLKMI